jgi:DNA-binding NarL/FixJ family response regulator
MAPLAEHVVGRAGELALLDRVLGDLDRGRPGAVELVGEPGVGKTRLIRELIARAEQRGHLVLSGSASELEQNLPFSVFVNAVDEYVESLELTRLRTLDDDVQAELARVFPSLSALAGAQTVAAQHERYRSHRAVRELLHRLAERKPLVLVLDDFHWADSASVELLSALLRRPPAAAVLITLATRPHQVSHALAGALQHAHREEALTRITLGALSLAQARELLGEGFDATQASVLYEDSGGNPFYLEQLARALKPAAGATSDVADLSLAVGIPSAVAAALTEELSMVSDDARLVLEGAAVAGDPFEPELAAAASGTLETSALDAIDELLRLDLVRATTVPRRFRFRHPLVRRAVYEATPAAWRLGAHARCAEALETRGVAAAGRAHHIERSARQGDGAAVGVLREAGEEAARLAPGTAAHWFAAALRLLPEAASAQERVELLLAHAEATAAAGRFADSHETLLLGLASVPQESIELGARLATACARLEHRLGQYEQAHARLVKALGGLSEPSSAQAVDLMIELALNEFYRSHYTAVKAWAERAVSGAQLLGDPPVRAAALAVSALADTTTGAVDRARAHHADAAALVDSLSDEVLSRRLDAAAWLAAAELYLDLYAEADRHAGRALRLARASGQGELFLVLYQILGRVWCVRGKLAEASDLLDGAIEAARLSRNTQALAGHLFNRSVVAVAAGDLVLAVTSAQESVNLVRDLDEGFVAAWAAVRLAGTLLATGQPAEAVDLIVGSAGGEELILLPGGWKAYGLELLTRSLLELGRRDQAERAATHAEVNAARVQLPLAAAWAQRAVAAVALYDGNPVGAAALALASAAAADQAQAPIEAALSRTLAGRALAQAGHRDSAIAELQRAATDLDACGARRYRDEAERELGTLGHRIHRRTRPGNSDVVGIDSLTERELQVARLVVDRKTNAQIAAELFLSVKTVETHLRHIFLKMEVPSRVALARAIQRDDTAAPARHG